jgi:hypothetical protein
MRRDEMNGLEANRSHLIRRALVAGLAIALTWTVGELLDAVVNVAWRSLARPAAIVVLLAAFSAVSISLAVLAGWIRLPGGRAQILATWAARQLPYTLRDLFGRRRVSLGRDHQRWERLADFEAEDRRRGDRGTPQCDYGRHWRDKGQRVGRLTHILSTGEVITVADHDGRVELLARIPSESRVETLLVDHSYASLFQGDIRWVRHRLAGWNVPLPPKAQWWLEQDQKPLRPWPGPPLPSVSRRDGAYHGRENDSEYEVLSVDEAGTRPLYHAVEASPTGYSWGYIGAGSTDMARSLLLDRLGYVPQSRVVGQFRNEVVVGLGPVFVLTYAEVDAWINNELFAENPRAVPLDPFAAGGAYDDDAG